jgi:hypothetical protein
LSGTASGEGKLHSAEAPVDSYGLRAGVLGPAETLADLNCAADPTRARIPYLYLIYIAVGLLWYLLRRKQLGSA